MNDLLNAIEQGGKLQERIAELEAERDRYKAALEQLAFYGDADANEHLRLTGSYSLFDEPRAMKIARAALEAQ